MSRLWNSIFASGSGLGASSGPPILASPYSDVKLENPKSSFHDFPRNYLRWKILVKNTSRERTTLKKEAKNRHFSRFFALFKYAVFCKCFIFFTCFAKKNIFFFRFWIAKSSKSENFILPVIKRRFLAPRSPQGAPMCGTWRQGTRQSRGLGEKKSQKTRFLRYLKIVIFRVRDSKKSKNSRFFGVGVYFYRNPIFRYFRNFFKILYFFSQE